MNSRAQFPRASVAFALIALLALGACSLLDPNVGRNQAACGAQAGSSVSGYGPGAAATDAAGTCGADAGSECDDCESRWCCQTRLACYADPVCDCADKAMDTCTSATQGDATVGRCWEAFSATGDVAKSRLACLRAWCQEVCGVP